MSRSVIESISMYIVDAQRDIFKDIRDKKSAWSRATSEINITDLNRAKIQNNLDAINKSIVKNSSILETMKKTCN